MVDSSTPSGDPLCPVPHPGTGLQRNNPGEWVTEHPINITFCILGSVV